MVKATLAEQLIELAEIQGKRQPTLRVQFVPSREEMGTHPERKCTCKPLRGITFCYCLCGGKKSLLPADTGGRESE